jgi:hypothetical protein
MSNSKYSKYKSHKNPFGGKTFVPRGQKKGRTGRHNEDSSHQSTLQKRLRHHTGSTGIKKFRVIN